MLQSWRSDFQLPAPKRELCRKVGLIWIIEIAPAICLIFPIAFVLCWSSRQHSWWDYTVWQQSVLTSVIEIVPWQFSCDWRDLLAVVSLVVQPWEVFEAFLLGFLCLSHNYLTLHLLSGTPALSYIPEIPVLQCWTVALLFCRALFPAPGPWLRLRRCCSHFWHPLSRLSLQNNIC